MMKNKPQRMCMGCNSKKEKRDLKDVFKLRKKMKTFKNNKKTVDFLFMMC